MLYNIYVISALLCAISFFFDVEKTMGTIAAKYSEKISKTDSLVLRAVVITVFVIFSLIPVYNTLVVLGHAKKMVDTA